MKHQSTSSGSALMYMYIPSGGQSAYISGSCGRSSENDSVETTWSQ